MRDTQLILAAAQFAAEKHAKQRRKGASAEPYVNHVIEVAHLVSTALSTPDANLIAAALLHDVIEDTAVTAPELSEAFGPDVTALVLEMTDDKSLPKAERKRLQIEHASHLTPRAQVIKLADKISNLRSIFSSPPADWDYDRRRQYFIWGKKVVDGLTAPNPILKAKFEQIYQRVDEIAP